MRLAELEALVSVPGGAAPEWRQLLGRVVHEVGCAAVLALLAAPFALGAAVKLFGAQAHHSVRGVRVVVLPGKSEHFSRLQNGEADKWEPGVLRSWNCEPYRQGYGDYCESGTRDGVEFWLVPKGEEFACCKRPALAAVLDSVRVQQGNATETTPATTTTEGTTATPTTTTEATTTSNATTVKKRSMTGGTPSTWTAEHADEWTHFCWTVVRAGSYEQGLVEEMWKRRASLFACHRYAVVGDDPEIILGAGATEALRIATTQQEGMTPWHTSLNTNVFLLAWRAVADHGGYLECDWVVKQDPDAVFFPGRLNTQLAGAMGRKLYSTPWEPKPDAGTWVTSCDRWAPQPGQWGGGWPMMYGALEIISTDGYERFARGLGACEADIDVHVHGEDDFLGQCLRSLRLREVYVTQADKSCQWDHFDGPCTDSSVAAFHPKKDMGEWISCFNQASGSGW